MTSGINGGNTITYNLPHEIIKGFHDAIHVGEIQTIQRLLDVNTQDKLALLNSICECRRSFDGISFDGMSLGLSKLTALQCAVCSNQVEACRLLIEYDCDVNARCGTYEERTALHYAAYDEIHVSIIQLLIDHGADVNDLDGKLQNPLHFIGDLPTRQFNFGKFQILLDAGTSVDQVNLAGMTPLHSAVDVFHSIEKTAYHDGQNVAPCVKATQMVLEKSRDKEGLINNNHDIVKGMTALHVAAASGCDRIIRYLLQQGANVKSKDRYGLTPLCYVAEHASVWFDYSNSNKEVFLRKRLASVDILLAYGADFNETDYIGDGPLRWLLWGAEYHTEPMLRHFVSKGANVNQMNTRHETLFHLFGTEVDGTNRLGKPMNYGIWQECVHVLKMEGLDINSRDINGCTPLHCFTRYHEIEMCEILLNSGADINAVDKFDRTCLHYCYLYKVDSETINMMLKRGASDDVKDKNGMKPSEYQYRSIDKSDNSDENFPLKKMSRSCILTLCKKILIDTDHGAVFMNHHVKYMQSEIHSLLNRISDKIAAKNAKLRFTPELSGSMGENTKIKPVDEFDYLLFMDHLDLEAKCDIREDVEQMPGYAKITLKESPEIMSEFQPIFNAKCKTLTTEFGPIFYRLFQECLGDPSVWKGLNLYWIDGPLAKYRASTKKAICDIILEWPGQIDTCLEISVDIVPVLRLNNWYPDRLRSDSPLLNTPVHSMGSIIALCKSPNEYPPSDEPRNTFFRISFSHLEKEIMLSVPEPIKDAYRLAKILSTKEEITSAVGIDIDDPIPSYWLKMAFFHVLTDDHMLNGESTNMYKTVKVAIKMFEYLANSVKTGRISSYFLIRHNVEHDPESIEFRQDLIEGILNFLNS